MKVLQIHILDYAAESLESLESLANRPSGEALNLAKKQNPDSYRSFLGGRAALNQLIQNSELDLHVLPHPKFGFLQLSSRSGEVSQTWHCNISHTESVAVAALSSSPVGVDIEKQDRSVEKVISRIADQSELDQFESSDFKMKKHLIHPHLLLWTGKEAFSKAIGLGMRQGLKEFRIGWMNEQPFSATTTLSGPLFLDNPTISFSLQKNLLVSVCFEKGLRPLYFS